MEPLSEEDLTFDTGYTPGLVPAHEDYHTLYVIEMSNLSAISKSRSSMTTIFTGLLSITVGDIITAEYSPRCNLQTNIQASLQPQVLENRLKDWESTLPEQLRMKRCENYTGSSFWACMAQMSYQ